MILFDHLLRAGTPHPVARGVGTALGIAGALLAKDAVALLIGWLVVLLLLWLASDVLRAHVRFVLVIMLPITVSLLIVWGGVVGAPPGVPPGSAPRDGIDFAFTVALRLAVLGGVAQLALLTIPADELAYTFRRWGLSSP